MHLPIRVLFTSAALAAALALVVSPSSARRQAQQSPAFERRELTIPMRDGTTLFAVALVPREMPHPLPILLIRTPFSAEGLFRGTQLPGAYRELAEDGYIFVLQDIRGRFRSEGTFVVNRAPRDARDPRGTDESTDAYDTIDWLVKQLAGNNGKVGVLGTSYGGWLAGMAGVGAHPALTAISPQAPMTDTWMGDDFFHQGAFRLTSGVEFATLMEANPGGFQFLSIPEYDHYEFYLKFPTLDSVARATGVARLPSWARYVAHPTYDAFWQRKAMQNVLTRAEVPTLFVGGWWDQEDILGAQLAYRTLERSDSARRTHIVLGPWFHNGWLQPGGDSVGPLALGSNTSDYFRREILRPWFAYWLHGKGSGAFPEAWVFETGANRWHTLEAWPPRQVQERRLYLQGGGALAFTPPAATPGVVPDASDPAHTSSFDAFLSDPAHPVPYVPRPDDGSAWSTLLLADQRFVHNRPDVVSWETAPLPEDMTIAGDVAARLFASTTGSDADWVVKLIDVFPDSVPERPALGGYQLIVNADIMRGRYWKGFSVATPIVPNAVTRFDVDLHQQFYRFRKGHRMMVQVQSSWFPLYDRNPQTFVPNIFRAKASDFRAQQHRIWHTPRHPSHVSLPVMVP